MAKTKYLSMNGEIVPYADAKIHTLSACVKYGAGVFEGHPRLLERRATKDCISSASTSISTACISR